MFKKSIVISLIGGFVLGKAGDKIFGSKEAIKAYTKAATCAFIAKDCVMEEVEKIQAAASDIAADARVEADKYQAQKDAEYDAAYAQNFDLFDNEEAADVEE